MLVTAALHSRCGRYILQLRLLSSSFFFFPHLFSAFADWMSTNGQIMCGSMVVYHTSTHYLALVRI